MKRLLLSTILAVACIDRLPAVGATKVGPPKPYGPVPSARQLSWHEMEFYGLAQRSSIFITLQSVAEVLYYLTWRRIVAARFQSQM
jgi:hypothetical protein